RHRSLCNDISARHGLMELERPRCGLYGAGQDDEEPVSPGVAIADAGLMPLQRVRQRSEDVVRERRKLLVEELRESLHVCEQQRADNAAVGAVRAGGYRIARRRPPTP